MKEQCPDKRGNSFIVSDNPENRGVTYHEYNIKYSGECYFCKKKKEKTMTIELTNEDAELFKLFRQYQDQFKILIEEGVMKFSNGRATIHKDALGEIALVEITSVSRPKKS